MVHDIVLDSEQHVADRSNQRMIDVAGATVYRGILGYGAKGHEHKHSVFHPMRDLPIMLSVIDSPEKIAAAAELNRANAG